MTDMNTPHNTNPPMTYHNSLFKYQFSMTDLQNSWKLVQVELIQMMNSNSGIGKHPVRQLTQVINTEQEQEHPKDS